MPISSQCPRQDSNLRTRLRRPALYPLSYEGVPVESSNRLGTYAAQMGVMPLVLLVDDEPVLLRMLEVNLRIAGFDVRTASSGTGALDAAAEVRPDVVVLDLGLPDLDGWEVLGRLRASAELADTPVIVLSGTDRDAADDHGYASSVHAFLTKPVEPADLVETVRRAAARTDG